MFTKRDAGSKASGRVQGTDHSPVNEYFHWSSASDIVIRGAVKPRPSWWGIRHRRPPQKLKAGFLLLDVLLPMRMRAPAQLAANGDSDQRTSLPPPLCDLTSVPNFELTVFIRDHELGHTCERGLPIKYVIGAWPGDSEYSPTSQWYSVPDSVSMISRSSCGP